MCSCVYVSAGFRALLQGQTHRVTVVTNNRYIKSESIAIIRAWRSLHQACGEGLCVYFCINYKDSMCANACIHYRFSGRPFISSLLKSLAFRFTLQAIVFKRLLQPPKMKILQFAYSRFGLNHFLSLQSIGHSLAECLNSIF